MNASDYLKARIKLGTQAQVAERLGVARSTVERREKGKMPITNEAALAIKALSNCDKIVTKKSSKK